MSGDLGALRELVTEALRDALGALDPARLVRDALPPLPPRRARVQVIAAGKAALAMTRGALARWPDRIEGALVVTVPPLPDPASMDPRITIRAAAHPVPDARSVAAAEEALRRAASLGPHDLLLALISGGASSLLSAPPEGMSLDEKRALVAGLLDRGVPIRDVNLVRRHLSRIKGGRLALAGPGAPEARASGAPGTARASGASGAIPARVLTLIVSDVIGGEAHDVGSGPTVPDPTLVGEARAVLARAGFPEPPGLSESLKPGLVRTRAQILAEPATLARAVAAELARRGIAAAVDAPDEGDALAVVERRLARAAALAPGEAAVIACEPTVRLPATRGHGGRAGFVALAAMRRLPPEVVLLCAASDGVDGSSGAAGAIVSRDDAAPIDGAAIDRALEGFDDASVHRILGTHLPGGPSGQNLADVHVVARLSR